VPRADRLFDCVPEPERRALRAAARRRRFRRGDAIFHEGEAGDSLHVIDSGHVAIRAGSSLGDTVTLSVLGPGDAFGEQALLSPDSHRTASAVCLDPVQTLALAGSTFEDLRARYPAVDRFLVEVLAAQVRRLSSQLVESLHVDAETRIVRRLATLAEMYGSGGGGDTVVPVTQDDIASMAGTTRPTVNRTLKALEHEGLVVLGRARVSILDPDRLAGRAGRRSGPDA
jgi:CRP/FNR family cyclic AMP-dependent transcriptional regulator